jgi:hypothetical protein
VYFQHFARFMETSRVLNGELVIIATICYISVRVNFEPREVGRFIRRLVWWTVVVSAAYLITIPSFDAYTKVFGFMSPVLHVLHYVLGSLIDAESFFVILLIVPMYVGIRNFTTRDAFWLGRKVLWNRFSNLLYDVYVIVIVAVSLINSALPLRISVSWMVAKDKAMLLKNPDLPQPAGWFKRLRILVWLFASTLIGHNSRMAIAIETLTHQRGMFRKQYRDVIAAQMSPEDVFVLILFALVAFMLTILRLS